MSKWDELLEKEGTTARRRAAINRERRMAEGKDIEKTMLELLPRILEAFPREEEEYPKPDSPYVLEEIEQTCGGCPASWEGRTEDGKEVYIKVRWGFLGVYIDDEPILGIQLDETGWLGIMEEKELKRLTRGYLDWGLV